jgi:hypothetical protein
MEGPLQKCLSYNVQCQVARLPANQHKVQTGRKKHAKQSAQGALWSSKGSQVFAEAYTPGSLMEGQCESQGLLDRE